jgi:hypothetical protein
MTNRPWFVLLALVVFLSAAGGCKQQNQEKPVGKTAPAVRTEPRVVIPASVKGKWRAVKIEVQDKSKNQEQVYTVDIGKEFTLDDSKVKVKVLNFLPAFIMDGTTMTSVSNETRNPAALVVVTEEGKQIFKGWLFSLYPGTHAFQHPRFSLTLVGYVRAKKRG